MTLPTVEEQSYYGMIVENPLWKLEKYNNGYLKKLQIPVIQECKECHLYTEGKVHETCVNCGLKF